MQCLSLASREFPRKIWARGHQVDINDVTWTLRVSSSIPRIRVVDVSPTTPLYLSTSFRSCSLHLLLNIILLQLALFEAMSLFSRNNESTLMSPQTYLKVEQSDEESSEALYTPHSTNKTLKIALVLSGLCNVLLLCGILFSNKALFSPVRNELMRKTSSYC